MRKWISSQLDTYLKLKMFLHTVLVSRRSCTHWLFFNLSYLSYLFFLFFCFYSSRCGGGSIERPFSQCTGVPLIVPGAAYCWCDTARHSEKTSEKRFKLLLFFFFLATSLSVWYPPKGPGSEQWQEENWERRTQPICRLLLALYNHQTDKGWWIKGLRR